MNEPPLPIPDLTWMPLAAEAKPVPEWYGDVRDKGSALWAGLVLCAGPMEDGDWWWTVYLEEKQLAIASSHFLDQASASCEEARAAAEQAARSFLFPAKTS